MIDKSDRKQNCFDILRYIGSVIVMLSHSFRHFGVDKPSYALFFLDGSVGVMMFFSMTGYLMMSSWERHKTNDSYLQFITNRIIKIMPPIIFSFVVVSMIDFIVIKEEFKLVAYLKFMISYIFLGGVAMVQTL